MKRLAIILMLLFASTAYAAALNMAVTFAGAGDGTGVSGATLDWDNAMSLAQFTTDITDNAEAGDVYYIAAGTTYVLPAATPITTAKSGTAAAPISLIGVKAGTTAEPPTTADYAYGDARPYFDAATNTEAFSLINYWVIRNIRFITDGGGGIQVASNNRFENVFAFNNKDSHTGYEALNFGGTTNSAISCEIQATGGTGIFLGTNGKVINSYVHDCARGVYNTSYGNVIVNNVFDTCTVGVSISGAYGVSVIGNTFSTNTTGILATTAFDAVIVNNIFDECTAPATWGTNNGINWFDYNSWDGRESENTNVTIGEHGIDSDITLNADFTVQASSAVLNAGLKLGPNTGIAGSEFKQNIGADQDDNAAASGGGQHTTKQGGKQ